MNAGIDSHSQEWRAAGPARVEASHSRTKSRWRAVQERSEEVSPYLLLWEIPEIELIPAAAHCAVLVSRIDL